MAAKDLIMGPKGIIPEGGLPKLPAAPEPKEKLTVAEIKRSGKSCIDLPTGDFLVSYRDGNRRVYVVLYTAAGKPIAVGVQ